MLLPCAVGIEADSSRIQALLTELAGKDLQEILAEGKKKLAAMPASGPAASAGPAAAGGAAPAAKKEEKKEEKEESDQVSWGARGCHAPPCVMHIPHAWPDLFLPLRRTWASPCSTNLLLVG